MVYLEDLAEESVQTFIYKAKQDGFSELDIEGALSSKVQDLDDTFNHLNLKFDKKELKITAMDNETLPLKKIIFKERKK